MTKDFNIKITVRNARLLNAIRENWDSVAGFCRETEIDYSRVSNIICMRERPITSIGEWKDVARDIAAALGMYPDELWPEHIRDLKAKRSTAEIEANTTDLAALTAPNSLDARRLLAKWSEKTTPRRAAALAMWAEGETLRDIGRELNVGAERVRQMTIAGMRDIKKAARRDGVESVTDIDGLVS